MKRPTFAVIGATLMFASCAWTETAAAALPFVGTSLSGAEWNVTTDGVTRGGYHVYPDANYVPGYDSPATFAAAGMTIFRFPIDWENVQPVLGQPFDPGEFLKVTTTVADLTALGVIVVIDLHNYARYDGNVVGSAQVPSTALADFWSRMAKGYADNPRVAFDLMNEPHDMPTEQWASAANAAIAAIRSAGAKNLVFVEGNGWTGADSWSQDWYGTPDATVMLTIADSADNYVFEAHQYLDPQSTGGSDTCQSATIGSERVQPFTDWLRQNKKRGFLGEFNGGANATCYAALTDLLDYLDGNADVYLGWTWWASGPEWGSSPRVLEPGRDDYQPYLQVLQPHFHALGTDSGSTPADAGGTMIVPPSDAGSADDGAAGGGTTIAGDDAGADSNAADASSEASGGQWFGPEASAGVLAPDAASAGLSTPDAAAGHSAWGGPWSNSSGCSAAPGRGLGGDAWSALAFGVVSVLRRRLRFWRGCRAATPA